MDISNIKEKEDFNLKVIISTSMPTQTDLEQLLEVLFEDSEATVRLQYREIGG